MPLYDIKLKVNSQALSTNSSELGKLVIQKSGFSRTGTNEAGSQIPIIPVTIQDPTSKNQKLFFSDYDASLYSLTNLLGSNLNLATAYEIALKNDTPIFEESKINSDHAISSKMPEPLAIFSFKKNDVENILSSLYQAYVEDACSQKFLERIFQIVRQTDPDFFARLEKSIATELSAVQNNVEVLDSIFSQINLFNGTLNSSSKNTSNFEKYFLLEYFKFIAGGGNDSQGRISEIISSLDAILSYISKDPSKIIFSNEKSQTTIITQLLHLSALALRNGSSSLALGEKMIKIPAGSSTIAQKMIKDEQTADFLKLSSLSTKADKQSCYIYGVPGLTETLPYTSLVNLSSLSDIKNIRKVAYLSCLIAQELTLSAGITRLEKTPLGDKFLRDENYIDNFFGTSGLKDAHAETKKIDSLVDSLVVSADGSPRVAYGDKKVLLFDGTKISQTETTTNVVSQFLNGIFKNPSDPNSNRTPALEKGMNNANLSFSDGTEFLRQVYLTDRKLNLLSPRGLFTRLLKDFTFHLSSFTKSDTKSAQARMELAMLSLVGKNTNSSDPNDPGNIVKRYMLSCIARTAISEIRKFEVSTYTLVLSNKNQPPPKPGEIVLGSAAQLPTLQSGKIRFSSDDKKFIESLFSTQDFTDEFLFSFFKIASKSSTYFFSHSGVEVTMTPATAFSQAKQISFRENSFLDSIAKIFVDLVKEAVAAAESGGVESSSNPTSLKIVDENGFTKNLKLDATIILGVMLEAVCILADSFIEVEQSKSNFFVNGILSSATGTGKSFDKQTREILKKSQLGLSVKIENSKIEQTLNVLTLICNASEANDLNSLTIVRNGKEVIPNILNDRDFPIQNIVSKKSADISPSILLEILKDLADERNMPVLTFDAAKSLVLSANESSQKIIKTGKQLLGTESPTKEIQNFLAFSQTSVAKNYFSSINEFTLSASKQALSDIKSSLQLPSKKNPKLSAGIYNCISTVLPEIVSKNDSLIFLVAGLPTDYVKNSLSFTFSIKDDITSQKNSEIMKLALEKKPAFSQTKYENVSFDFYVRPIFNDESFSQFTAKAKQFPISLADVVNKCVLDNGKTGLKEKLTKTNQAISQEILENEVASYLMKKMFSVLSSADLFEGNISTRNMQVRSANSVNLARKLSEAYGLSASTFDSVFLTSEDSGTVLDKQAILDLSIQKISDAASSIVIDQPKVTFGEAEIFYDLFSTVYFLEGRLAETVFSPTLLDRTVGALFSPDEFKIINFDPSESSLEASKKNSEKCSIDSYSIDVVLSTPVENT